MLGKAPSHLVAVGVRFDEHSRDSAMAESSSTVGPVPRTHSDYPHLSDEEWNAVGRLAHQLGEEATLHMLSMSEQAQKSALRNFISSNVTTSEVRTTSTANTKTTTTNSNSKHIGFLVFPSSHYCILQTTHTNHLIVMPLILILTRMY